MFQCCKPSIAETEIPGVDALGLRVAWISAATIFTTLPGDVLDFFKVNPKQHATF